MVDQEEGLAQDNTNLKQGSVSSVCRATGDREELNDVVESCSGSGDDVLVGYAEVGREFTIGDSEELEALLGNERVVGGRPR